MFFYFFIICFDRQCNKLTLIYTYYKGHLLRMYGFPSTKQFNIYRHVSSYYTPSVNKILGHLKYLIFFLVVTIYYTSI